jgi:hypothetical protein
LIGWEVRILADNEQQDDYLSNMLNALNEKEQESQSYNDPETIARQAKEKLEAENAVKEANEPEREADADAKLEALLDNTPLEEAAGAKLTSDDNSELSDDDMKRLMNMNLDDIIDDVKSDSASIDDLFGSSPDKETEHNGKSADTQAQTISADDKKKLKPQKEGFFKKIKKVFFDSLEDDTETAESASEAVGEKESIEENVVKSVSDIDDNPIASVSDILNVSCKANTICLYTAVNLLSMPNSCACGRRLLYLFTPLIRLSSASVFMLSFI